ncbi:glycerophosphodiester phosphodiesterase family protein [Mucilaginibacter gynuensis]|uniref:Glycerophosphodiester phosphodiesterase family protein n=1 Tax=Mucilaginibacter gynuensis TaxID=1302236 RepID=A0ABP8H875_9SPHI
MNNIFKGLLLIALVFTGTNGFSQTGKIDKLIKQLHNPTHKHIMVAAHRGDWRNAPENSLQAYQNAIDMGVDIIEVDLGMTKDSVIIIMHDGGIDRTTDGRGSPANYTLAEIKKFHLRNGLGILTTHTIPTLKEVMLLAKNKVLVNLDKSYPYYQQAYKVLQETNTLKQAIFKSDAKYEDLKAKYPTLFDKITYMPVVNIDNAEAQKTINSYQQNLKPVAFELIFGRDTSGILSKNTINAKGSKIWINSLWASLNGGHYDDMAVEQHNTRDSWDWLIAHGANILQTDRPKEMIRYLKERKLRD